MDRRYLTKRVKIWTGHGCNLRCRFCYYLDFVKLKNPSFKKVKEQLDVAKKQGIVAVDFSGGEPTIRPDFIDLVRHAKKLGFKTICTLTNGIVLANKEYAKKAVEAGLNEVLFSVHGCDAKNHDWLTQFPGAFKRIMMAIDNLKELGVPFRANVTVTSGNYKFLDKHVKIFLKKKPFQVNFIVFNDWCGAKKVARELSVKYSVAAPRLKKAIDNLKKKIKYINVRYIPFCFMRGYEKYVCDHQQKLYDLYEWYPPLRSCFEYEHFMWYIGILNKLTKLPLINNLIKFGFRLTENPIELLNIARYYRKSKSCRNCKYGKICDGLEKTYAQIIGFKELRPEKGKKIQNPMFYRKDFYKEDYRKYYKE